MRLGDVFKTSESKAALRTFCAEQIALAHARLETTDPVTAPHQVIAAQVEIKLAREFERKVKAFVATEETVHANVRRVS